MSGQGIPEHLFGAVPQALYGAVGQVVLAGSLLELRLLDLLEELDQARGDRHAGQPPDVLIRRCQDSLPRYQEHFAAAVRDALDRAAHSLDQRDAVVHRLWPVPRPPGGLGWRHLPPRAQTSSRPQRHLWVRVDLAWLRALHDTLIALVDDVDRLRQDAPDARPSSPA